MRPAAGVPPVEAEAAALLAGRQSPAATGKDLPEAEDDGDKPREDGADIAFAWFAVAPVAAPVATGVAIPAPAAGVATDLPAGTAAEPAHALDTFADGEAPGAPAATEPAPADVATTEAAPTDRSADARAPAVPLRQPQENAAALAAQPPRQPVATTAIAAFGPAIEAALATAAPAAPTSLRRPSAIEPAGLAVAPGATESAQPQAVAAPADLQQAALDTRRQEWMGKMVEHIEALRDASPARETRLSLMPEALGKVDVAIRHEDGRVHVHFTTETPAARQLIADAQPRLSELAEARGLKLGQTSFESGTAGQGPHRDGRAQTEAQQPSRPRPATSETVGTADDDRIA